MLLVVSKNIMKGISKKLFAPNAKTPMMWAVATGLIQGVIGFPITGKCRHFKKVKNKRRAVKDVTSIHNSAFEI